MNKDFHGNIRPLIDLSTPDEQELNSGKRPVLETCHNAKTIAGIDFDAIREKWYPAQAGKNVPCSVDALIFQGEKIYLVEFKSGGTNNPIRKIYDSVMMLIEHDNRNFQTMRKAATYIIVSPNFNDSENCDKAILRATYYANHEYSQEPWNDPRFKSPDKLGLRKLEGIIVAKTYCMSPNMFDKFVKHENWG